MSAPDSPKPRTALRLAASALAFLALTVVLWAAVQFVLYDDIHSYTRVMMDEMYGSEENIDVLFLGSSHCYRSFDPAMADGALGLNTFNAGTSQQQLDGSYYLLREVAKTNKLQTVYLETFYATMVTHASQDIPLACYLIADEMKPSRDKFDFLWEMGGAAALFDALVPARHNTISPGVITETWRAKLTDGYDPGNYTYVTYPGEDAYRGKGFVYVEKQAAPDTNFAGIAAIDPEAPISDFCMTYLDKIVAFCAENGIELVFVSAPLPDAFVDNVENYQLYDDTLTAYAARNGLLYWDFCLYKDLPMTLTDFSDAHHLSGEGAEKFTDAFGKVAAAHKAGQDVSAEFYPTVAEKLATAPDETYAG